MNVQTCLEEFINTGHLNIDDISQSDNLIAFTEKSGSELKSWLLISIKSVI